MIPEGHPKIPFLFLFFSIFSIKTKVTFIKYTMQSNFTIHNNRVRFCLSMNSPEDTPGHLSILVPNDTKGLWLILCYTVQFVITKLCTKFQDPRSSSS